MGSPTRTRRSAARRAKRRIAFASKYKHSSPVSRSAAAAPAVSRSGDKSVSAVYERESQPYSLTPSGMRTKLYNTYDPSAAKRNAANFEYRRQLEKLKAMTSYSPAARPSPSPARPSPSPARPSPSPATLSLSRSPPVTRNSKKTYNQVQKEKAIARLGQAEYDRRQRYLREFEKAKLLNTPNINYGPDYGQGWY